MIGRRQSSDRQFNAVLFAKSGRINLSCPNSSQEAKEFRRTFMAETTKDFNASLSFKVQVSSILLLSSSRLVARGVIRTLCSPRARGRSFFAEVGSAECLSHEHIWNRPAEPANTQ